MSYTIDQTDRIILNSLQTDASEPLERIAERASISVDACKDRVKSLEDAGIIRGRVTLLEPEKLGLGQVVFVAVKTNDHSVEWLQAFADAVSSIPEVSEFYRMAGDVDYLLKITCTSVADYDRVYKTLIRKVDVANVSASFAMECIKNTTEIPV